MDLLDMWGRAGDQMQGPAPQQVLLVCAASVRGLRPLRKESVFLLLQALGTSGSPPGAICSASTSQPTSLFGAGLPRVRPLAGMAGHCSVTLVATAAPAWWLMLGWSRRTVSAPSKALFHGCWSPTPVPAPGGQGPCQLASDGQVQRPQVNQPCGDRDKGHTRPVTHM